MGLARRLLLGLVLGCELDIRLGAEGSGVFLVNRHKGVRGTSASTRTNARGRPLLLPPYDKSTRPQTSALYDVGVSVYDGTTNQNKLPQCQVPHALFHALGYRHRRGIVRERQGVERVWHIMAQG